MEPCLFCENLSGSPEHLWPAWIHEQKDFGPVKVSIGGGPVEVHEDPEETIDTVCTQCNNTWMSATENKVRSIIGWTLVDLSFPLDRQQQSVLSNWAVKTAMVLDSVKNPETHKRFYRRSDCLLFRKSRIIPSRVRIWIGRSAINGIGAYGTDISVETTQDAPLGLAAATTIIVGYLAVQVVAMRANDGVDDKNVTDVQPKPGDWGNMLSAIWPIERGSVIWPPKESFTKSGARSIATLMSRWKISKGA